MNDQDLFPQGGSLPAAQPTGAPAPKPAEPKDKEDQDTREKIFDISSDFTISPIEDAPRQAAGPITFETVGPIMASLIKKAPAAAPIAAPAAVTVPVPPPLPIPQPPKKPASMEMPAAESTPAAAFKSLLKPLRTYESDVADVLAKKNISRANIAIAERERQGEGKSFGEAIATAEGDQIEEGSGETAHRSWGKLIIVLACIVLVVGGLFGAYYLYIQSPLGQSTAVVTPSAPASAAPQSLVTADGRAIVSIDGLTAQALSSRIESAISQPGKAGTIREVILSTQSAGQAVRAAPSQAAAALGISVPDIIMRTLSPAWMLGSYTAPDGTASGFVVVQTDFFQNAFAGMLQWESSMPYEFEPYLAKTPAAAAAAIPAAPILATSTSHASTTAQSTTTAPMADSEAATSTASPIFTTTPIISGHFEDHIVKNIDTREYVSPDGSVLFLYSFLDDSRLVVAANESALSEIISRLEQQSFIQ